MLIEAIYEKKQAVMTYDNEIAKLQAKVQKLGKASAEKETCIDKSEAIIKESEGEINK